jgi:23S rRNA (pseudouridine1915-N3)-methyltransferase
MRIHFITVGEPKLAYAKRGWDEYYTRLGHYHTVQLTRVDDRKATDELLLKLIDRSYAIPLDLKGMELSSEKLATKLESLGVQGEKEISFVIGGPDGFGDVVRKRADFLWKLSDLTLPHDLAMVVMLEALYRATTIVSGHPYHR